MSFPFQSARDKSIRRSGRQVKARAQGEMCFVAPSCCVAHTMRARFTSGARVSICDCNFMKAHMSERKWFITATHILKSRSNVLCGTSGNFTSFSPPRQPNRYDCAFLLFTIQPGRNCTTEAGSARVFIRELGAPIYRRRRRISERSMEQNNTVAVGRSELIAQIGTKTYL